MRKKITDITIGNFQNKIISRRKSKISHVASQCRLPFSSLSLYDSVQFFRRTDGRYHYYYLVPRTKGIRNARRRRRWPRQSSAI